MQRVGKTIGSDRVLRGGSWYSYAVYCRVSARYGSTLEARYDRLGFRLASSPQ